ncbi:MAG: hypothetical protein N4A31_03370 [Rickettsiales bacterium]|nr:hypothetical protein [Rickettsiales bacterium]
MSFSSGNALIRPEIATGDHLALMILSITKLRKLLLRNKDLFLDNPEINFASNS